MTTLVLLLLLGFGAVVVAALFVWSLLTPARRPAPVARPAERPRARSNDEVRGAKARAAKRERPAGEDAFERFLRAGRDEGR